MDIGFFILGWAAGMYSISNLIVAVFFFIPYAKRHAHLYMPAPRINKYRDLFDGPVPYGVMLTVPIIATLLLGVGMYFAIKWNLHALSLFSGIALSAAMGLLSTRDKAGNHQRSFNLSWGKYYRSNNDEAVSKSSLYDMQLMLDLPEEVRIARERLLKEEGIHDQDPETDALIKKISVYSRPEHDAFWQTLSNSLATDSPLNENNLADWELGHYVSKQYLIFPKALLRATVRIKKDKSRRYCFSSTVGR